MKIAACGWCMGLGLSLACGVAPTQIGASGSGQSASSSTGSSGSASSDAVVDGTGPIADGSGEASSQGVTSAGGGTTQGVQPDTSTGGTTGSASTGTTAEASEGNPTSSSESSSESSGMPIPSCDDLFGAAPGYLLCDETDEECHFNATTGGGNCDQMCGMFGATCNAAFDNPNSAGQECAVIRPNTDTCATTRGTEICVCAK